MIYRYVWKNNEKRQTMFMRRCRVIARGKMNSVRIKFYDDGQEEIVSRYSLRRLN